MAHLDQKLSTLMVTDVVTQSENISIDEATLIMTHSTIGAIVILDDNRRPTGIFTERDIVTRVIGKKTPEYTQLKDIMSKNLITLKETDSILEAAKIMSQKNIRHIVVTCDTGSLKGIISIRDTNRFLLEIVKTK